MPKPKFSLTPQRIINKKPKTDQLRRRIAKAFARDMRIPVRNPGPPAHLQPRQGGGRPNNHVATVAESPKARILDSVVLAARMPARQTTVVAGVSRLPSAGKIDGAPKYGTTAGTAIIRGKPALPTDGAKTRQATGPVPGTRHGSTTPSVPGAKRKRTRPVPPPTNAPRPLPVQPSIPPMRTILIEAPEKESPPLPDTRVSFGPLNVEEAIAAEDRPFLEWPRELQEAAQAFVPVGWPLGTRI